MDFKLKKKGFATIFMIIGIFIIIVIGGFFLLRNDFSLRTNISPEKNPNVFLESCLEGNVESIVNTLLSQGGYAKNPLNITFQFENEKKPKDISYLCYVSQEYLPCVNQEPMLIQHIKREIHQNISSSVKACFYEAASNLKKQGFEVESSYDGFDIDLFPKKIIIKINGSFTRTKSGETLKQKGFSIVIPTDIYSLAIVAQEIISQEARFCNFDSVGFMLLNPKFNIYKFRTGDSSIIYSVLDKKTKEKFVFAIRGCVIPPGA